MHRTFSKVGIAGAAFVVVLGLTMLVRGDVALKQRTGFPQDWSHSHLIFANPGSFAQAVRNGSVAHWYRIMNDPRYQMQQLRQNAAAMQRNVAALKPTPAKSTPPKPAPPKSVPLAKDWNFSLQTTITNGGVPALRYPAQYSFNETGASCANDFVIYGLYSGGSSTQANLVGVNNLYVGAAGGGGCSSITNNGGAGSAPTPQVKWAFNVSASPIHTSVVLSLDGTKVAYVVDSNPAVLQVLTLGGGGGTVTAPISTFGACNTAAPSICNISLSGSTGDEESAPYVDYGDDVGYVGDNSGHIYKITGFFKGTPALPGGTYWATAGSGKLGSPVYDGATGTVFVGSSDGSLYAFNSSGTPITGSGFRLDYGTFGLWLSPPIVDSTNHLLYQSYGYYNAGAGVAQVVFTGTPTIASTSTSSIGTAGTNTASLLTTSAPAFYITDGAFSRSYFNGFSTSTSFLYACGANNTGTTGTIGVSLQQFTFNAGPILSGTVNKVATIDTTTTVAQFDATGVGLCSPLTEFYNTNGTPTDYLFLSDPALTSSNLVSFNITNNTAGGALTPTVSSTYVPGGASGLVVDGADTTTNASSLYFTSQTATGATCTTGGASGTASPQNDAIGTVAAAICAYKLTQSGLQ